LYRQITQQLLAPLQINLQLFKHPGKNHAAAFSRKKLFCLQAAKPAHKLGNLAETIAVSAIMELVMLMHKTPWSPLCRPPEHKLKPLKMDGVSGVSPETCVLWGGRGLGGGGQVKKPHQQATAFPIPKKKLVPPIMPIIMAKPSVTAKPAWHPSCI
jgi:hypothetical protein